MRLLTTSYQAFPTFIAGGECSRTISILCLSYVETDGTNQDLEIIKVIKGQMEGKLFEKSFFFGLFSYLGCVKINGEEEGESAYEDTFARF